MKLRFNVSDISLFLVVRHVLLVICHFWSTAKNSNISPDVASFHMSAKNRNMFPKLFKAAHYFCSRTEHSDCRKTRLTWCMVADLGVTCFFCGTKPEKHRVNGFHFFLSCFFSILENGKKYLFNGCKIFANKSITFAKNFICKTFQMIFPLTCFYCEVLQLIWHSLLALAVCFRLSLETILLHRVYTCFLITVSRH